MKVEPQKEHKWLEQLLGDWTFDSECNMGPDQPPGKYAGTESVRSLGSVWVLCEGKGEMGGGVGLTQMMLGYDPAKKRFVGTFIGSMMTHMWVYDGEMDAAGKVLTLSAEGPDFANPGRTAKFRDVIEVRSDDHRVLTSHAQGPDGTWTQFMEAHYRRVK